MGLRTRFRQSWILEQRVVLFVPDDQSRGVEESILDFGIEEKGDHCGFFNPKSKIQN